MLLSCRKATVTVLFLIAKISYKLLTIWLRRCKKWRRHRLWNKSSSHIHAPLISSMSSIFYANTFTHWYWNTPFVTNLCSSCLWTLNTIHEVISKVGCCWCYHGYICMALRVEDFNQFFFNENAHKDTPWCVTSQQMWYDQGFRRSEGTPPKWPKLALVDVPKIRLCT